MPFSHGETHNLMTRRSHKANERYQKKKKKKGGGGGKLESLYNLLNCLSRQFSYKCGNSDTSCPGGWAHAPDTCSITVHHIFLVICRKVTQLFFQPLTTSGMCKHGTSRYSSCPGRNSQLGQQEVALASQASSTHKMKCERLVYFCKGTFWFVFIYV